MSAAPRAPPQVILAFDFGRRRIGIAAGDTVSRTARPLRTLTVTAAGPDWAGIERQIREHAPGLILIGAPYNEAGGDGPMTRAAAAFAAELAGRFGDRFGVRVQSVDERYSSIEAAARLKAQRASGARGRVQRGDVDSAAAAVILETWLSQEPGP